MKYHNTHKFISLLLVLLLVIGAWNGAVFAAEQTDGNEAAKEALWQTIAAIEDASFPPRRGPEDSDALARRSLAYAGASEAIAAAVEQSGDYTPGSLERHGDFLFWQDGAGEPYGYSPGLRTRIRAGAIEGA